VRWVVSGLTRESCNCVEAAKALIVVADFAGELPTEKCSEKATAFGVVTNPNRVHSGVSLV
jgi:hypothetical protein